MSKEAVDHPEHYNAGRTLDEDGTAKFEPIKIIEAWDLGLGFCLGNAIKYVLRAPHKDDEVEDLEKALWYLKRALDYCGPRGVYQITEDPDDPTVIHVEFGERVELASDACNDWGVQGWLNGVMKAIAMGNIKEAVFCLEQHLGVSDDG